MKKVLVVVELKNYNVDSFNKVYVCFGNKRYNYSKVNWLQFKSIDYKEDEKGFKDIYDKILKRIIVDCEIKFTTHSLSDNQDECLVNQVVIEIAEKYGLQVNYLEEE